MSNDYSLIRRLDLVETQGKQNKRVPILLTKEMSTAIETLISTRDGCGINEDNPYIFANNHLGFIDTWHVLQTVDKEAGCT